LAAAWKLCWTRCDVLSFPIYETGFWIDKEPTILIIIVTV
jgi:hypothetical protein